MQCERFFHIIAVGRMKDKNLDKLTSELLVRLRKYGKTELTALPDSDVAREGAAIIRELDKERNSVVFVLSEEGTEWGTTGFAAKLEALDNKITYLERISFGELVLDNSLKRGEWRYLTDGEIALLEAHAK